MRARSILLQLLVATGTLVASSSTWAAPPLSNITQIALGSLDFACALTSTGGVKCWGDNANGALGDGTTIDRSVPGDVVGLTSGVAAIATGERFGCALTSAGGVKCWGGNMAGNLGDGTTTDRYTPVDVVGLTSGVVAVSAGSVHACALTLSGGMKCWGDNTYGQLGDGTTTRRTTPGDVLGLTTGVTAIAVRDRDSCAIVSGGAAKCWGSNAWGQLGDGSMVDRHQPTDVTGLSSGVLAIAPGPLRGCAIVSGGAVKCWGFAVGDGTLGYRLTPVNVTGLASGALQMDNEGKTCAVVSGGTVKCWAYTLPDSSFQATPADVSGLAGPAMAVGVAQSFTCVLLASGQVMCWGQDDHGQMGNATVGGTQAAPDYVLDYVLQTIDFPAIPNHDVSDAPFTVSATATSGLPVALTSPTTSVCTLSGSTVTLVAVGICSITAQQPGDTTYYQAAPVTHSFFVSNAAAPSPPRLANISTRGPVLTGDDVMIGGFIIQGSVAKTILIRARGPSLASSSVTNALANPKLDLYTQTSAGQTKLASNDDWQAGPYADVIQSLGMAPADPLEAAILVTLQPGAYTPIVSGVGGTGVAIVEVFEMDHPDNPLVNISTRAKALNGNDAMIAGFVIQGTGSQAVVVRARGPSLAGFSGIPNPLSDPMLTLVRSSDQTIVAANDNWHDAPNAADITASGFAPSMDAESAILVTLPAGAYTAVVTGVGGATGTAIVEVFRVP